MKKLAFLSDIHANIHALTTVWNELSSIEPDGIYHLGDLVGYNPFPEETIDFVIENNILGLAGNYDLAVSSPDSDPVSKYLKPTISKDGRSVYEWTRENVKDEHAEFLYNLPRRMEMEVEKNRIVMVHGSPVNVREYLRPESPDGLLESYLEKTGANILLCGHTHLPMVKKLNSGWVINPGSVGKPKDGDPRACCLILTIDGDNIFPEIIRLDYPVDETADAVRKAGLPEVMARGLIKGTSS